VNEVPSSAHLKLKQALHSMEAALQLLDEADAPADLGAHLDMAICRLNELLPAPSRRSRISEAGSQDNGH